MSRTIEEFDYAEAYACSPRSARLCLQRNRVAIHKRHKKWYEDNVDSVRTRNKLWHEQNREKISARHKAHYQANREAYRARGRSYYLANQDKVRAWHKAWKNANREAVREANRAWVQANREAHNAKGHRRRARMAQVQVIPFSPQQLAARWAYYGNKCWLCRGPASATDHVKPISKGGSHMLCNLRPICKPCNSAKHNKWPVDTSTVCCG